MKKIVISIVVPVYQAEKYISKTIESVLQCSSELMELILVDDGSTDHSLEICQDYARIDKRVRIIHQENAGVCAARNAGILHASGEYIFFLDADDMLCKACLKELFSQAEASRYDFIAFAYESLFLDGRTETELFPLQGAASTDNREIVDNILFGTALLYPCWGKLYRRSILIERGILFQQDVSIGEDYIFVMEYLHAACTCLLINTIAVSYLQNENGAVRSLELSKRLQGLKAVWDCCLKYTQGAKQKYRTMACVQQFLTLMYSMRIHISSKQCVQNIMDCPLMREVVSAVQGKDFSGYRKIEYFFAKHHCTELMYQYLKIKAALKDTQK